MSDGPVKRGSGAAAVFRSLAEIPASFGPAVAAIGNFDGVHLGHRKILDGVVKEARNAGAMQRWLSPLTRTRSNFCGRRMLRRLLTPITERVRLLAAAGVDAVLVLAFDAALASLTPREFVQQILVDALGTRSVHEGQSFRFGHGAAAGVGEMAAFGAELGFVVHVHKALRVRGMEVSSSAIRELVASGDVRRARWMLGRPFSVLSTQARGRGIGTRLLVPTVNLAPYDGLLPAFGVYVTRVKVNGRIFKAVTNLGNRPTFGEASFAVESHILDFEPIEMDETTPIELEFLLRLRGEIEWPSPEALKAQILKDVARAQRYFRHAVGITGDSAD